METRGYNAAAVRGLLRELGGELADINQMVGTRVDLRASDLACLDMLARIGPVSPGAFAKRMHIHPATMTGILDRLETGGWAARERDPNDRRRVLVRAISGRARELIGHYAGMNTAVEAIAESYSAEELAVIGDFLIRAIAAGRAARADLGVEPAPQNMK